jgi:hypothetical protein
MNFNFKNLALAGLAVLGLSFSAGAQTFDMFNATRTYILAPTQNIGVNGGVGLITNTAVDHVKLLGRVKVDFIMLTNSGTTGGTLTAQLYTAPDNTNFTALANYALISSPTTDIITNAYYPGTNTCANSMMLPGTATYPTAATAGYATPYLAPLPFTNTGAFTLNGNPNVQVAFNITDQPRYIRLVYTAGGTVTNFTGGAILTGYPILP